MRRVMLVLLALTGLLWSAGAWAAEARSQLRTVRGEVVAVNRSDTPPVIVVAAKVGKKQEELIVGASVEAGAQITRGTQRLTLSDIKVGQTVELTYVKNEQGLRAQSIRVK